MSRLSTMPTIPDDTMEEGEENWRLEATQADPESDSRCRTVQPVSEDIDAEETTEVGHLFPDVLAANRELFLDDLLRVPAVLIEQTPLRVAVELFGSGMEGPVVVVTDENRPLGVLTPTRVLSLVKERPIDELTQVTLMDVATPCDLLLRTSASPIEAAELFVAKDCDVLVVVDDEGELAGVLLARDLCLLWV